MTRPYSKIVIRPGFRHKGGVIEGKHGFFFFCIGCSIDIVERACWLFFLCCLHFVLFSASELVWRLFGKGLTFKDSIGFVAFVGCLLFLFSNLGEEEEVSRSYTAMRYIRWSGLGTRKKRIWGLSIVVCFRTIQFKCYHLSKFRFGGAARSTISSFPPLLASSI